jgi:hypothetical protein
MNVGVARLFSSGANALLGSIIAGCAFSHSARGHEPDVAVVDAQIASDTLVAADNPTDHGIADDVTDVAAEDATITDVHVLDVIVDFSDVRTVDATDVLVVPDVVADVIVETYRTDPNHVTTTSWNGSSSPGAQTQIRCADTEVVTGILMNANDIVNSFGLHCSTLQSDGTLTGDRIIPRNGGSSGTDYDDLCPPGHVVTHAVGRAGSLVDAWGGECSPIDAWLAGTAPDAMLPVHGGTGGNAFSDACRTGSFVRGLDYDVYSSGGHDRVWRVKMECFPIIRTP